MEFSGLYAITAPLLTDDLVAACRQALAGGVKWLQYRAPQASAAERFRQCRELLPLCREYHAKLIVNDEATLAQAVGADGVHLEWHDADVAAAREFLGPDKIIGRSCMGSLDKAQQAIADGADYVSFGCFFASQTKPEAAVIDHVILAQAQALSVPLVAIGGITRDNAPQLIEAGADAIAVVQSLFASGDIEQTAREFGQLFEV